ncbi:hypothetical protein [Persicirhabdus sediminis]|nr:hypothetical protein [Persicirhabdus sediminis]
MRESPADLLATNTSYSGTYAEPIQGSALNEPRCPRDDYAIARRWH